MSAKRFDFERFARVCHSMVAGEHRSSAGLIGIVELVTGMNPSGRRRYNAEASLRVCVRVKG